MKINRPLLELWGNQTLNWLVIIVGHVVFLPSIIALLTGITDNTPSLDIFVLVQFLLVLSYIKSLLSKDLTGMSLHSLGWATQASLIALIIFK